MTNEPTYQINIRLHKEWMEKLAKAVCIVGSYPNVLKIGVDKILEDKDA